VYDSKTGKVVEDCITRVTYEQYTGYVYDLSVPHYRNYVAGGVVVHNSVYMFRGADHTGETKFFAAFPEAKVYALQGNFRSTVAITELANRVIEPNPQAIGKKITATRHAGTLPRLVQRRDPADEADFILDEIYRLVRRGQTQWRDCVVLYRTRFQSRALEVAAVHRSVPYRVVGALGFYSRTIVKDVLAYLKLLYNPEDDAAFVRLHNQPRRGIGDNGMQQFCQVAAQRGTTLLRCLRTGAFVDQVTGPANQGFRVLHRLLKGLRGLAGGPVGPLMDATIRQAGFRVMLEAKKNSKQVDDQLGQLDELVVAAHEFDGTVGTGLKGFLDHVALMQQTDGAKEDQDRVLLMTVHAAKGQEFTNVWVAGCCDGLVPIRAHDDGEVKMTPAEHELHQQEERRIFYVAITRAKDNLTLVWPASRNARGGTYPCTVTPLLHNAGPDLLDRQDLPEEQTGQYCYRGPQDFKRYERENRYRSYRR
jgi:DNA helicase-2/ATP-dependent DNA helicase PcrA